MEPSRGKTCSQALLSCGNEGILTTLSKLQNIILVRMLIRVVSDPGDGLMAVNNYGTYVVLKKTNPVLSALCL